MSNFISYFKRNIYFMISIITVFVASVFAITIFIVNDISDQPAQTTLGSIYLGGHEESQYDSIINSEINTFMNIATYEIKYQNVSFEMPLDFFTFDKDQTLNQLVDDQKNLVVFEMSSQHQDIFVDELANTFSNDVVNLLDLEKLNTQIISDLGQMLTKKQYQLDIYFLEEALDSELNVEIMHGLVLDDVTHITDLVQSIHIPAKSQFSLLDSLASLGLDNEQLSIIANGMLKVLLKSHMNGFTFETYPDSPTWAPNGFNVRILKVNGYDFAFYNPYDFTYSIEIEKVSDTSISFTLVGIPYVNVYDYMIELRTTILVETIYIANDLLDETTPGVIVIDTATETTYHLLSTTGTNGFIYDIIRTTTDQDGLTTNLKLYDILYPGEPTIYEEHIVEKDGA